MIAIPYEIVHHEYAGDTMGQCENMRTESEEECWEARTEKAVFLLVFGETEVHEVKIGVRSSVNVRLDAANESDLSDRVTFIDKPEYCTSHSLKSASYRNTEVTFTQYSDRRFSRLQVQLSNIEPKQTMKVVYIRLFKVATELKRRSEEPAYIPKRPKIDPFPATSTPALPQTPPETPPYKPSPVAIPVKPTIQVTHKLPSVCYDKAETSYNQLLHECVVTCLDDSEHVRRLCDCLGAVFLDHLEEYTTHVVVGEGLIELCRDIGERTRAKLVSVGWLESCLEERERKREEEYRLV